MLMSRVCTGMVLLAVFTGMLTGRTEQVCLAVSDGAQSAVSLLLTTGGSLCLWSGVMEVMQRSGLSDVVARALGPVISCLFGSYAKDQKARSAIARNMAANLLGLGSAATPAGLQAAKRLQELCDRRGEVPHAVFLLLVINTASMQLLPTTVAAVRAGLGAQQPYDILPAVWLASALSVLTAVVSARLFRGGKGL